MVSVSHTLKCLTLIGLIVAYAAQLDDSSSQCSVTFAVDPSKSNITIEGSVVKPITQTLEITPFDVEIGFQGEMRATFPGPCPSTGEGLEDALAGLTMTTTDENGPLNMFPASITFDGGSFVTLKWNGYEFDAVITFNDDDDKTADIQLTIVGDSYTLSLSLLTPEGTEVDTVGLIGQQNGLETNISSNGNEVSIELLDLAIPISAPYSQSIGNQVIDGLTNYSIKGSLALKGAVGCQIDCGAHGRCAPLSNDTTISSCLCECGYSGESCDIPSGYCPQYLGEEVLAANICSNISEIVEPNITDIGEYENIKCISGSESCSSFEEWNPQTGKCDCKPGWSGPNCDTCETDAACSTYYSENFGRSLSAVCEESRIYAENTVFKSYNCDLGGTGLEDTIVPGTFSVGCNTTSGSSVDESSSTFATESYADEGLYCDVGFSMQSDPNNKVICRASLCSFEAGESQVQCRAVYCSCASACPDLKSVFSEIEGQPCVVDCDEDNFCTFDIKNFFVKLVAQCATFDCRVDGYRMNEIPYSTSATHDWDYILAFIPFFVVLLCAGVLSGYLIFHKESVFMVKRNFKEEIENLDLDIVFRPDRKIEKLSFSDLSAIIDKKERIEILSKINGVANCGDLIGILGPSGSGKTSLLAALAGSADDIGRNVTVTGSILIDNEVLSANDARRIAYCAQDSMLLPTLTVEESIRYSALLRTSKNTPIDQIKLKIDHVIFELGLAKVAQNLIGGGSGIRGISGGERRRVAIAMELVIDPSALLLDEPTSGLDSTSAFNLMKTLKHVARSGRIVILTFHQPSPSMFNLLDQAILLAQGKCIYKGDPLNADKFFASIGYPCPELVALSEHMLSCVSDLDTLPKLIASASIYSEKNSQASPSPVTEDRNRSQSSEFEKNLDNESDRDLESSRPNGRNLGGVEKNYQVDPNNFQPIGLTRELSIMFWRTAVDIIRNPTLLALHWVISILIGIFVGCIFWQVGNDVSGAQNRAGGLFFALAFFAFTSLTIVDLLMGERRIVNREVRGGYYRAWSYLLSKFVLDGLLLRSIPTFLYTAAFYPMMGLQDGAKQVLIFIGTLSSFSLAIGALSLAVAVGCKTSGEVSFAMNIILLLSLLVGGFFVNVASIPDWIEWLHYISPFYYAYTVLITNEMSSLLLNFVVKGYTAVRNVRGTTFLDIIGITLDATKALIVLDAMYFAFIIFAFILLYTRLPRARWFHR